MDLAIVEMISKWTKILTQLDGGIHAGVLVGTIILCIPLVKTLKAKMMLEGWRWAMPMAVSSVLYNIMAFSNGTWGRMSLWGGTITGIVALGLAAPVKNYLKKKNAK
jgi:hypothetical protein